MRQGLRQGGLAYAGDVLDQHGGRVPGRAIRVKLMASSLPRMTPAMGLLQPGGLRGTLGVVVVGIVVYVLVGPSSVDAFREPSATNSQVRAISSVG